MTDLALLSRALTPPEGYSKPTGFERFFPYQAAATAQESARHHLLLAHAPGLGKTPIALALLRGRTVIICPPTITQQWQRRALEWTGGEIPVLSTNKLASQPPTGSFIVADSLVHALPQRVTSDTLIIDEVHRLKSRDARRTAVVFGGERYGRRFDGLAHQARRVIALTGTPLQNSPVDLYPLLSVIAPSVATSFEAYTSRYCPPVEIVVPRAPFPIKRYDKNMQNLDELNYKLRSSVMIRPDASQCQLQLPDVMHDTYYLPIDDPYEEVSPDQIASVLAGDVSSAGEVDQAAIATMRREVGIVKSRSPQLISWLLDLIDDGDKPLVWCWHQEAALYLSAKLELPCITGGMPMSMRERAMAAYHTGKGLVATIGCAGTGLDGMQRSGALCVFVEQDYVPGGNEQAWSRLHRAGQTRGVRVVVVKSPTTVDRGIEAVLKRKSQMISQVLR